MFVFEGEKCLTPFSPFDAQLIERVALCMFSLNRKKRQVDIVSSSLITINRSQLFCRTFQEFTSFICLEFLFFKLLAVSKSRLFKNQNTHLSLSFILFLHVTLFVTDTAYIDNH